MMPNVGIIVEREELQMRSLLLGITVVKARHFLMAESVSYGSETKWRLMSYQVSAPSNAGENKPIAAPGAAYDPSIGNIMAAMLARCRNREANLRRGRHGKRC